MCVTMWQELYKYIFLYIHYKIYTLQSVNRQAAATAVAVILDHTTSPYAASDWLHAAR